MNKNIIIGVLIVTTLVLGGYVVNQKQNPISVLQKLTSSSLEFSATLAGTSRRDKVCRAIVEMLVTCRQNNECTAEDVEDGEFIVEVFCEIAY